MQREERKEADTGPEEVPAGERAGTGELADREGYAGEMCIRDSCTSKMRRRT